MMHTFLLIIYFTLFILDIFRTSNCSSSREVLYEQLIVFHHAEIILKLRELSSYRLSSDNVIKSI